MTGGMEGEKKREEAGERRAWRWELEVAAGVTGACIVLLPAFSWAVITHAAVSNLCLSTGTMRARGGGASRLGRRSAPWCIPSHPISIWMRGRGKDG